VEIKNLGTGKIMKTLCSILFVLFTASLFAQSTSCSTATPLTLDNVVRTYSSVNGTGTSFACMAGAGMVSWFSFTTNAAAECVDIAIETSPANEFEVTIYDQCSQRMQMQDMCSVDGKAHWATSMWNQPLQANRLYRMRLRATGAYSGAYSIQARYLTPQNNLCGNARPVDGTWQKDHNCCNVPSGEVTPPELCAGTLENTAWYSFTTTSSFQASIINIRNLNCDNIQQTGTDGFQVGFFTGPCTSLINRACTTGNAVNGFVQYTAPILPAGTQVFVAIDGIYGSNCEYEVQATNAVVVRHDTVVRDRPLRERRSFKLIYDASGRLVYQGVGVPELPKGYYFVVEERRKYVLLK
jgi:hypothetical protein